MDESRRFSIESKGKFFDDVMSALNNGDEVLLVWSKQIDEDNAEIHQSIVRWKEDCPACDKMSPLYLAVQLILHLIEETKFPKKDIYQFMIANLFEGMMADAHADSSHQEVVD